MGLFGIGTYQPISGGTQVGPGFPIQPAVLAPPFSGVYGGTYGYVLDTTIRAPKQMVYTPAPLLSLDAGGSPVVRGWPEIIWTYSSLRPDYWYYFQHLYHRSAITPPGFQYLVLLQYPDESGNNTPVQTLAYFTPPTHSARQVGAYLGVTLHFTKVGFLGLDPGTPIQILS